MVTVWLQVETGTMIFFEHQVGLSRSPGKVVRISMSICQDLPVDFITLPSINVYVSTGHFVWIAA